MGLCVNSCEALLQAFDCFFVVEPRCYESFQTLRQRVVIHNSVPAAPVHFFKQLLEQTIDRFSTQSKLNRRTAVIVQGPAPPYLFSVRQASFFQ